MLQDCGVRNIVSCRGSVGTSFGRSLSRTAGIFEEKFEVLLLLRDALRLCWSK